MDRAEVPGVSRDELRQSTLGLDSKRRLEPMLASRGFDLTRTVHVVVLASGEGIVPTHGQSLRPHDSPVNRNGGDQVRL
jgi:hypothetical protein